MATSGRGSGVVGYNVQVAVDTDHHLIIAHEVRDDCRADLADRNRSWPGSRCAAPGMTYFVKPMLL
jgi:hypothetical protein